MHSRVTRRRFLVGSAVALGSVGLAGCAQQAPTAEPLAVDDAAEPAVRFVRPTDNDVVGRRVRVVADVKGVTLGGHTDENPDLGDYEEGSEDHADENPDLGDYEEGGGGRDEGGDHEADSGHDEGGDHGGYHLHVMVDVGPVEAGDVIPRDANHVHFAGDSREVVLDLSPGQHTLTLQLGDGKHRALDVTDFVTVEVVDE